MKFDFPLLPLTVSDAQPIHDNTKEERSTTLQATIALLIVTILISVVKIPLIFKYVAGLKKMLIALQQFCVVSYFLVVVINKSLLTSFMEGTIQFWRSSNSDYSDIVDNAQNMRFGESLSDFFRDFFQWEYYFLSLLQSFDIYVLICKPFQYHDFAKYDHILKIVSMGTLSCFLLASDQVALTLISCIYSPISDPQNLPKKIDISRWINVAHFGKQMMLKVGYTIAVVNMAKSVKQSLINSRNMANKNEKFYLHLRLFYFTLIPIFLNLLFATHEILSAMTAICIHNFCGKKLGNFIKSDLIACLTGANITTGTFVYFIGYFLLFSELRKVIYNACKRMTPV